MGRMDWRLPLDDEMARNPLTLNQAWEQYMTASGVLYCAATNMKRGKSENKLEQATWAHKQHGSKGRGGVVELSKTQYDLSQAW